jgi:hypothetical protein
MSKIEENITDNCHFQRKRNENQYKHNVKVMSTPQESYSNLENSELSTQKVVAAKEEIFEISVLYVQER